MPSRRFTEKQTAEIMRRATEIQAQDGRSSGSEGVSEDELRAAARELGVSGGALDAALREIDSPRALGRQGLWGGPHVREVELVFEGQITDERWEEVVADLRRTFGETGTVDRRGTTYEWAGTGGGVDYNTVTTRQSGNTVRVSVTSNFSGLSSLAYILAFVPLFIGVAVASKLQVLGSWTGLAIAGWAGALFLGARFGSIAISSRRERRLNELGGRIRALLATDDGGLRQNLATSTAAPPSVDEKTVDNIG